MLALVPDWAYKYGEFWQAIRARNLWFIRLRYAAVAILLAFLLIGQFILEFNFSIEQIKSIVVVSVTILIYNYIIYKLRDSAGCEPKKFNSMHISLIQMICDLTTLMFLVYYTGTIDSPLYMLFIFHMIIGSLILPGEIVYLIAGMVSFIFAGLIFLERTGSINNHLISGLYSGNGFHTFPHDMIYILIFGFMLFGCVFITNRIAKQLYQMEFHLRDSLEKLNESEKAKQRYTLGIVHEIKTPINAVMSILDLVHDRYVGPISVAVDEKIIRAKTRTAEALHLINNILHISKLKLLDVNTTDKIDIRVLVSMIIDELVEPFQDKNISFNFVEKRIDNRNIKTDRVLLELAVKNVLTNAVKYVDKNGRIDFTISDSNDKLNIIISDNGIGIPAEEIHKIFEQFYRASNINKSVHEGSGLGLSLVKEIIEKLGGKINVFSPSSLAEDGKPGTTFEIIMPYIYRAEEYDIFEVNDQDYLSNKNTF